MAIIDQPKPSEPKSPQPEVRPLQPGQTDDGRVNSPDPSRATNLQTPDNDGEERNDGRRKF